jgi:hypothetical protein
MPQYAALTCTADVDWTLEAADLDTALKIAAEIPAAWGGAVEVRPVIDFGA